MCVINALCCCHRENKHLFFNGGGSVWGKYSSTPSRERKNLMSAPREREFIDERKITTQPSSHEAIDEAIEAIEDTKKEKRKLFERFRASVRASVRALLFKKKSESFSTAGRSCFPPQNRGVGQKAAKR